jgi:hypothetical protein
LRSRVDLYQLRKVVRTVTDIGHGLDHPRCFDFVLDCRTLSPDAFGISLHIQLAVKRVHSAFEWSQLA